MAGTRTPCGKATTIQQRNKYKYIPIVYYWNGMYRLQLVVWH